MDLTDSRAIEQLFRIPFDAVVHCAANIHIGWKNLDACMRINRDGTRLLLEQCARRGLRFIHVSTVNTLCIGSRNQVVDEETVGDGQVPCNYVVTKRAAEHEVVEAGRRGQDVVIVHPGFMLGPWDWKPSSGRMVLGLNGFAPLAPSGGCSVCDPRDVAAATLTALTRAPSGRHYILAGENLTYLDLWRRIAKALGKSGPITFMRLPAKFVASVAGDAFTWIRGHETDINSAAVRMSSQFHWYSSQRARDELDYQPRSADLSIGDAVSWLRSHGYL
jgi:dihydroflavonol-4-reductase